MSNIKYFSRLAIEESSNEITTRLALDMQYLDFCCQECVFNLIDDIQDIYGSQITEADYEYLYETAMNYLEEE